MHKLYSFKGGDIKTVLVGNKNETKKANESLLLDCFLGTKLGQRWYTKNKFTDKKDSEEPDFLFESDKGVQKVWNSSSLFAQVVIGSKSTELCSI